MNIDIKDPNYQDKYKIIQALYEVADPELGINIIDLGLVYEIDVDKINKKVKIDMTLSTPSCPLGGLISSHVKLAVDAVMQGYNTKVELVWQPKWSADNISDEGKMQLGW